MMRTGCIVHAPGLGLGLALGLKWCYCICVRTFGIDPLRVEVWQSFLVTDLLKGFGRFLVDDAARSPSPTAFSGTHGLIV